MWPINKIKEYRERKASKLRDEEMSRIEEEASELFTIRRVILPGEDKTRIAILFNGSIMHVSDEFDADFGRTYMELRDYYINLWANKTIKLV